MKRNQPVLILLLPLLTVLLLAVYSFIHIREQLLNNTNSVDDTLRTVLIFYFCFVLMTAGFIWMLLYAYRRQRKTALELKNSDDNIHLLLNNVKDYAIIMLDEDNIITKWNYGAECIYGAAEHEVKGTCCDVFYTDQDIQKGEPALHLEMAKNEGHLKTEGWRKKKDGTLFWATVVLTALRDTDGKLYGFSKITRDITEWKKTQEEIELLYRQVNQSSEGIYTVDANRKVVSWNKGAEELYGFTKEEALGKDAMLLLRTNLTPNELQGVMDAVGKNNVLRKDLHRKKKNGEDVFVHTSSSALRNEKGEITGYLIVNVDVTERKKLMEKVSHLASVVEQSSEAIISRGRDNTIISWNMGAEMLLGYTKEEVIGKSAVDLGFMKHLPDRRQEIENIIENKGNWKSEVQFYHKNGNTFWGVVTANVIKDEFGQVNSVVIIIKDITLRKQLEEQLKTANEQLEQKVKERTEEISRSELRYRSLIENSAEGISLLDEKAAILYRSPSGEKMLGIGTSVSVIDYSYPENDDMCTNKFKEAVANPGKPIYYRAKYRFNDGRFLIAEGTFTNMLHIDGVNAVVANYHDVTEQIQAEEKLAATDRRFRALIEKNYDVIMLFDSALKIVYRSPSATHMTGRTDEETMGNDATNNVHPDDLPSLTQKIGLLMQQPGASAEAQFRYRRKDGVYIWLEGTATNLLRDESVQGIIFNCRDVSKRKEAEEKLIASEERFRALIENTHDVINLVDDTFKVIYRSPSAQRVTGLTDDDILSKSIITNIHPDEKKLVDELIAETFARPGVPVPLKVRTKRKDGEYIWLEGVVTNLLHNPYIKAFLLNVRDISERVLAEEKLAASENRFRALVDNNQDVILLLDASYRVIYSSPSGKLVTGWKNEDLTEMTALDHIHPDDNAYIAEVGAAILSNPGKPFDVRVRHRHKDGHYIWLEGVATNLLNDSSVNGILFNCRDVSERIAAEEKLKEQQEQLKTLGDNLTGVMIFQLVGDLSGARRFTYVSNGVSNLTGKTAAEVMDDPSILYNIILEEDRPVFLEAELKANEQLSVFNQEVRCLTYKNEIRWVNIVSTPRKQQNGNIVWDGFHIDITERKEALKKLADSEVRFRSLIENSTDAIVLNDTASNILYQSPSVSKILGYSMKERLHKKSFDFVHPEEKPAFMQLYKNLEKTPGQPLPFQHRFLHKNGNYVWIEGVVTNLIHDPKVNAYVANYRDITERKEAEENIRQLNENLEIRIQQRTRQLKKTNEELEAFSYSISHDLRAPLRGIIGFASILEEDYGSKLDDEAKRITHVIKTNSLVMGNLIDDLLTFSRTGRHNLEKTLIHSNVMVHDIIAGINHKHTGTPIEWIVPALQDTYADPTTLKQVWINLLSNAVKYSATRNLRRIELGSYKTDHEVIFFVKDNGVGFDNRYVGKLFKVFQRLHTSDEFEGTGVGLAIVEKIITKHGGRVWAEGVRDQGASFYFSLPDGDAIED